MPVAPNRLAQNRAIFREVNERVRELSLHQDLVPWTERTEYFCECGTAGCLDTVELTLAEYESVRAEEAALVISPDHASGTFAIVEDTDRYLIVEKSAVVRAARSPAPPAARR
jgi:hypothetical protein